MSTQSKLVTYDDYRNLPDDRKQYEKFGVKEYWIVYPDRKKIEQFVLQDEAFDLKRKLKGSKMLTSEVISGFSITLKNVFAT